MRGREPELPPRRPLSVRRRSHHEPEPAPATPAVLPDVPPTSLRDAVALAEEALEAAGVAESIADARLMLGHALEASPTWVFAHDIEPVPPDAWLAFRDLVRRRCAREPLQHLLGAQEFFSQRFEVSRDVLIPRPETELLVEVAARRLAGIERARIADVGTGSGCIGISLAGEVRESRVVACDVSAAALAVAGRNAESLGFEERVTFVEGSLVEPLRAHSPFDAVVANLPYVTESEWEKLEPEVRDHDPRLALVAGSEGTELIEQLVAQAPDVLVKDGLLALEIGWTQAERVTTLLRARGWRDIQVHRDLQGHDRVVEARRPE